MAYTLTLTHEERAAIDWVGNRYSNGDDLFKLLWVHSQPTPLEADWDAKCDITFNVPEHVAWQIKDNADTDNEDGYWPCFADELASKMQQFIDAIV